VQVWSLAPDGQVTWANGPYREAFDSSAEGLQDHRIPNAFGHVLEEVPLTARGAESRARVSVPGREGAEPRWYEICRCPGPDGATLGFAVEADDLVAAEASLRRFVETLTETFAHLPIGLAVFDKNRRLGLFNPALTDLVRIDAVWLAGRPSLRDFLERLRETRQMPEQKDFTAWRRKLGELEEGARDGTYEENWVLPSGKVFRVTGRPHPQGALAFLFEDISTAIQLERRYRSELELSQATLDRLAEGVAVFDASGSLVFVNSAFETLWGLDSMERLDGPGVTEMAGIWAERCAPSTAWADIGEYATAAEARGSWSATIETVEARRLHMAVAPLPDASTLVVFRDAVAAAPARDPLLDELALEQIRLPVEAAVQQVTAAIAAARTPEAFQALGAAAQGLKDGLARSRELAALPQDAASGTDRGLLAPLAAALAARGLVLAVTGPDAALADPTFRRAVLALGLAGADLALPGATVEIVLDAMPAGRCVTLATPAGLQAFRADGFGMALARRVVEAAGGKLRVEPSVDRVTLVAELPLMALVAPPSSRIALGA
jgi:PAS domain-containing protein